MKMSHKSMQAEGALVIHDDLKTRDEMKKLQEGYSCKDLRYANMSRTQVILPSYKGTFRGQTTSRRVKKKKEMHICMKSIGKLQLKFEKYESKEDRIMSPRQEEKEIPNGRAQMMQGDVCIEGECRIMTMHTYEIF